MMLHTIIIDNRPVLREGIKGLLLKCFDNIQLSEFDSLQECQSSVNRSMADLIFLGGDSTAIRSIPDITAFYSNSKVIIYDPIGEADVAMKYLKFGAKGYLSKNSGVPMIELCVKMVLEGKIYVDPSELNSVILGLVDRGRRSQRGPQNSRKLSLTARQREIATLLAQGKGTTYIAHRLGLKASTISTVKNTIYAKLNINNIIDLPKALSS